MKLDLALRELHRSEAALAKDLLKVADRHKAEHEIHHVARDVAKWSADHVRELATAARRYDVELDHEISRSSGALASIRTTVSELAASRPEPGLLLLSLTCADCTAKPRASRWIGSCSRKARRPPRTPIWSS
ncbi:hypothetical protein [Kibdelosporangium aridum]|uniref:hypothetical protein n=1 Tax=Kibdelosporangium aridum TaxID=2030 RepID=UPI000B26F1A7|nr:hypothetical protein [Kibdelosporangium aridum]